jgi:hypothetical protein
MLTNQAGLISGKAAVRLTDVEKKQRNRNHIKTDHLLPNLKQRTISGGMVTMSAQAAKFGLNLVSTVILARRLTPRGFGPVAMMTAVTGFLAIVSARSSCSPDCAAGTHHACPGIEPCLDKPRRKRLMCPYSSRLRRQLSPGFTMILE